MSRSEGTNFEQLHHEVFSGETLMVPLLVDNEKGLTEDSNALLHASSIIGANLAIYDNDVSKLVDKVGEIVTNPQAKKGIIIEDEKGAGAVTIDHQLTQVSIANVGKFIVPTGKLFDMLYKWAEYGQRDTNQN